ncbi:MAG TPA: folylpolyglutamate synthase/dihydrofolate synthase family protein [Candidatus Omnitrophota bacterium]|nr:folylpolyglutamate synthase/dihydrofolate synthase family protein [Candidatus Omnitrophota bacterium]HQJ14883.1 folylpolyglutamate synthase/dihydrofolate synthase family protein [Candidatus Omnitrophota bacterium]
MPYQDTLTYLGSFINYERKPRFRYKDSFKLARIESFLSRIGDPHAKTRFIHVAGTKGKGSVCAFCASILRHMGYRVGLYTSPHLSDVRERLRVLEPAGRAVRRAGNADFEGMISRQELSRLADRLRPEITAYGRQNPYGPLSFFEVYTAFAFQYFKDRAVDFAVLETGLGGRLDATNAVKPHIVGITSISFDHMDKLGETLCEIAHEKAGIIKAGTATGLVVSAPQEHVVEQVLRSKCEANGCRLVQVGIDIRYQLETVRNETQIFNISGMSGSWEHIRLPLLGEHQLINAAVAVGLVAGAAQDSAPGRMHAAVQRGLHRARWPGRFEIVRRRPCVILDGAHNEASAAALAKTIRDFIPGKKIILVLGISKDKDATNICRHLAPLAQRCIVTRADNPRARSTSDIAERVRQQGSSVEIIEIRSVPSAVVKAFACAGADDTIVIAGSLFIVGEARKLLFSGRFCSK